MAVLLRVMVGGKNFPIETNLDLQNAVTAIRSPEHRGEKVVIFINYYYFPAAGMHVLEKHPRVKSDESLELESDMEQDFDDKFDQDVRDMFGNAEFMSNDVTRAAEQENESINSSFKSEDYYRIRQIKATRRDPSPSYYFLVSMRKAFNVILMAIGTGHSFSLVMT